MFTRMFIKVTVKDQEVRVNHLVSLSWLLRTCVFPGPNHAGEKYQEYSVCFSVNCSFHLSTQDDQLLPQQCVFCQQFGFTSDQIVESPKHEASRWWFDPSRNTFLQRVKAETDMLLDRGRYTQHKWNLFFVKIGAM